MCTSLHESFIKSIAKGLKRFRFVFDILFFLPSIVLCVVLMLPITVAQLNVFASLAKVQTLMHIL